MMDPRSITLAALVTAAELVILLFLYRDTRPRFFGWMVGAWSLRTAYFLVQLGPFLLGAPSVWAAIAILVSLANSVALFGSGIAYRRALERSATPAVAVAGTTLAIVAVVLRLDLAAFEAMLLVGAAIGFWPSGRQRVRGTGLLAGSLLGWAVVRLAFSLSLPADVRAALIPAATLLQALQMIAVIVVVLTAAKQRVEFLKDFNEKLVDGMGLGLALVARDLTVQHVNRWMTERIGADVAGRTCVATYLGAGRPCPECPWRQDPPEPRQLTADGPAGRKFLITCSPLTMPNGSPVLLELLSDVTEYEAMRARLLHSERLATLGHMASRVAHEIRNPLGVMALHTDLATGELRPDGNLAEAETHLAIVKSEIRGVAQLIETYLRVGRSPRLQMEPVEIDALVDATLTIFEAELGLRRIVLRRTSARSLPDVSADREQLGQALINVIRNAIEAMPAGGELSIGTTADDAHVEIHIADTGAGVRSEDVDRIFRPFETTKVHGTGLGLAVARQIVHEHGGTLVCRPGAPGARFVMTLPGPGAGIRR